MTTQIGDVYVAFYCPDCSNLHVRALAPLDEALHAAAAFPRVAAAYEAAAGISEVMLLATINVDDRPYAVAARSDGDVMTGTYKAFDGDEENAYLTAEEVYQQTAQEGLPLATQRADEAGCAALVAEAIGHARGGREALGRLLADVNVDL